MFGHRSRLHYLEVKPLDEYKDAQMQEVNELMSRFLREYEKIESLQTVEMLWNSIVADYEIARMTRRTDC